MLKNCLVATTVALALAAGPARATLVTLTGTDFDLTYDDTKLGLFNAPVLSGDIISFTFNNFVAESLNGQGFVTTSSTIDGIVLSSKNGFTFGDLLLAEFGDYLLVGPFSTVNVQGQLRAFDAANPVPTQTASDLFVNPATPLNIVDAANHDWQASARIDNATPVTPPLFGMPQNGWLATADQIGVTIENRLIAFTSPGGLFAQQAFIEKKFVGIAIAVMPVPGPSGALAVLAGLALIGAAAWRRRV